MCYSWKTSFQDIKVDLKSNYIITQADSTIALKGKKKKIREINLKTVRERKIYEKYSKFMKLEP